ncbi:MAG: hypothetical protein K0S33_1910 [Bacteroidetes bacterium]|jgi:hypothetical protein|nr:hypothetical protein [Bacteroidota bacterium]
MKAFVKVALIVVPVLLISCGGDKSGEELNGADTAKIAIDTTPVTVNEEIKFKFDFAVANVPSPVQLITDFSAYGISYHNVMLHDVKKVKTYTSDFSKACNLGVYNLDLAYAIANEQGADVMKYVKTSMQEANSLGLKSAFDQMMGQRMESNIDNKDSLLEIIDEIYVNGDSYLRTNERVQTATHIFVGSWVEALYIICSVNAIEQEPVYKTRIRSHLWDQRFYLKNLIDLLGAFKDKKEDQMLIEALTKIQAEIDAVKDPKDLDEAKFKSISDQVFALRAAITK